MPLYIDIHEVPGVTSEAAAAEHIKDIEIQGEFGVNYSKYWLNEQSGKIFCLCEAPTLEAAMDVHRKAHGVAADKIIEVTPELTEMFMGPALTDASGAVLRPAHDTERYDTGMRTVLFTDIVDSTALTQTLGDRAAFDLLSVHDEIVRNAIGRSGGREVKHTGDGIMAAFLIPKAALQCAARIQRDLAAYAAEHAGYPLHVRIGAAVGEPVEHHNDLFGATVQLAARLCAHAAPSQIVVSGDLADLCCDGDFAIAPPAEVTLKGFARPIPVRVVEWAS